MTATGPYPDGRAVEAAIKRAASMASARHPSRGTADLIRQAYFDRFLCRVFSDDDSGEWVLKGGTGVLARVADARATVDVDLQRAVTGLDVALAELRRMAERDLDDHFRFLYRSHEPLHAAQTQPYVEGVRVHFALMLGAKEISSGLKVDLVVGPSPIGYVRTSTPANRLDLPRLETCDYRLYPVEDQIADKVCATLAQYGGDASSREKDLVDLVVLATTSDLDMATLRRALRTETGRRRLEPFEAFAVPPQWGRAYMNMAAGVPLCRQFPDAQAAESLIAGMLEPVLSGSGNGTWIPTAGRWITEIRDAPGQTN